MKIRIHYWNYNKLNRKQICLTIKKLKLQIKKIDKLKISINTDYEGKIRGVNDSIKNKTDEYVKKEAEIEK